MSQEQARKVPESRDVGSSDRVSSLYRKAAISGASEMQYIDIYRPRKRWQSLVNSIVVTFVILGTAALSALPMPRTYSFPGEVVLHHSSFSVRTTKTGVVTSKYVKYGQQVSKGTKLIAVSEDVAFQNAFLRDERIKGLETESTALKNLLRDAQSTVSKTEKIDRALITSYESLKNADAANLRLSEEATIAAEQISDISSEAAKRGAISRKEGLENLLASLDRQLATIESRGNASSSEINFLEAKRQLLSVSMTLRRMINDLQSDLFSTANSINELRSFGEVTITSPINGIVSSSVPNEGTTIGASEPILQIRPMSAATASVVSSIPRELSTSSVIGGPVNVLVPIDGTPREITGRIHMISDDPSSISKQLISIELDGKNNRKEADFIRLEGVPVQVHLSVGSVRIFDLLFGPA